MRHRTLVVVWVAVSLAPALALADGWSDFIPRPFENLAFIDAYTSYERDHVRSGSQTNRWTDTFFREKLTLLSDGYSYHPRFMLYRFSISGAARQENYDSTSLASAGWTNSGGLEYDTTLLFLPEHTYNLQLFARRYEPLLKEQSATQHSNIENSRGASFRYRDKPYFLHIGYVDDSIESGDASSDVSRVNVEGEYFKRFTTGNETSVTGGYNPAWFSNSEGLDGSSTEYLFNNFLYLQDVPAWAVPVRVVSSVTQDLFDQSSPGSGKFENDQFVWYERASAFLPWNFRSDLYYRYQDNQSTSPGQSQSDLSKDLNIDVIHRLYESLDTTYQFLDNSRSSTGGDSTFLAHSLILNYTKLIPRGRILAGTSLGTGETDNHGQSSVLNEPHLGIFVPNLPGSFVLDQPNVEAGSIVVNLQCTAAHPCSPPLVTGQIVTLTETTDYTVLPFGNTFEIRVFNLPAPLVVPGTYDFLVSYALLGGDFKLRTNNYGGNVSVETFDNLLTPYFSYLAVRSDVVSGVFPGTPVDSTTYTTGLIIRYGPLQVRGEYQDLQWDVTPYQSWRAEVQYVTALNDTTSVFASGSYLNKSYGKGNGSYYPAAFTEDSENASGSIQKGFFDRNLYLSLGGSYTRVQGLVDTEAYTVSTSLIWKIGKVDITLGANAYQSDSSGTPGTISTDRDHEFVYLNLRRRIF